jgi:flagellar basal body-associated protein FliL
MPHASDKTRKKSSRAVWIFLLLTGVAVAGFLVYRNNRELFSQRSAMPKPQHPAMQRALTATAGSRQAIKAEAPKPIPVSPVQKPKVQDVLPIPVDEPQRAAGSLELRKSVLIPNVRCAILDKSAIRINLSLELFFSADSLQEEILGKREQIKVMIRKIMSRKRYDDVKTETVKKEIKAAIDSLLDYGALEDVEFRSCQVEPAPNMQ